MNTRIIQVEEKLPLVQRFPLVYSTHLPCLALLYSFLFYST